MTSLSNTGTVYDVKSNGVTIEFTRNFKDAADAYQASTASTKEIFSITDSGMRHRLILEKQK